VGVTDGADAVVESPYGSMRVRVQADAQQRRDTVFTEQGSWLSAGGTPNQLTGNVISNRGSLGAYNQVSVRLARGHSDASEACPKGAGLSGPARISSSLP